MAVELLTCPGCGAALEVTGGETMVHCPYCRGMVSLSSEAAIKPVQQTAELKLYWRNDRGDNFTTASEPGERDALAAGYGLIRVEGRVFCQPEPGTVPLKLFWNGSDNFSTATEKGEFDGLAAGYRFIRIEGYVYPQPEAGTVPLKLFWNGHDNFLTATPAGEHSALAAGYRFIRIEGYVFPA